MAAESAGYLPSAGELYEYFELDAALGASREAFLEEKGQLLTFCGRLTDYVRQEGMEFLPGVTAFLNSSALYGVNFFTQEREEQEDAVRLMTLHASKGLEFQCVFIIGVNYGLIPLQTKGWEEEEERRLFFVGMTRARDYLELSCYTNPGQPRVAGGESRYISLIPEGLLLREDEKKKDAVDLAQLRRRVEEAKAGKHPAAEQSRWEQSREEEPGESSARHVRHARYGTGIVKTEDETKISVEFPNYGVKEFIKAFTRLEEE